MRVYLFWSSLQILVVVKVNYRETIYKKSNYNNCKQDGAWKLDNEISVGKAKTRGNLEINMRNY
jgi:hypothetical protein